MFESLLGEGFDGKEHGFRIVLLQFRVGSKCNLPHHLKCQTERFALHYARPVLFLTMLLALCAFSLYSSYLEVKTKAIVQLNGR